MFLLSFLCTLQHLELVIEAVDGAEAEFPGLLVLVVEAVEAERGGDTVALRGKRGRLTERGAYRGHGEGRESSLRGDGRQVRATVEVRRRAKACAVGGRHWPVTHGIRTLHARGT